MCERLDPPRLHCEGISKDRPCDGGSSLHITRRARWIINGRLVCGTCKRTHKRGK